MTTIKIPLSNNISKKIQGKTVIDFRINKQDELELELDNEFLTTEETAEEFGMSAEEFIKEIKGGIKEIEDGESVIFTIEELATELGVDYP
jgi:hypothetical protein